MFGIFKKRPISIARDYFRKRQNLVKDYLLGKLKFDEHVVASEVAANTIAVIGNIDPLAPIDEHFISDDKKRIIGKVLYDFPNVDVETVKPKQVLDLIAKPTWRETREPVFKKFMDRRFYPIADPNALSDKYLETYETFKDNSKLSSPIAYSACVFYNRQELINRLCHAIHLNGDRRLNWDRLYLLLAVQETFEDYEEIIINDMGGRTLKHKAERNND